MPRRVGQVRSAAVATMVAAGLLLGLVPARASAHALLVSADPAVGANLATAPTAVTITFTETPDPKLSTIKVLDATGASMTSGSTQAVAGNPRALTVAVKSLPNGVYTVAWRTLSTVDGHLAAGSYAFGVGSAPPPPTGTASGSVQSSGSSTISPFAIIGRWLLYLGLLLAVGTSFIALYAYASPPLRAGTLQLIAWVATAIGTLMVVGVQVGDSGVGLISALGTSIGSAALLRSVPVGVGLVVVAMGLVRSRLHGRWTLLGLGMVGGAAMLSDALASHAAAGSLVPLEVAMQWLHIAAAGTWLGGLVALLATIPGTPGEVSGRAARRFAWSATAGIALVAGTGVLRAISEVGSLDALFSTGFGLVVVAKSVLILALAGLGAVNHFRNAPRASRTLRGLRVVGGAELVVAAVVLVLSATLVNLAPPVQAVAPGASPASQAPLTVRGNDFATTLKARLEVSPGTAGFNAFQLTLTDYDSGEALRGRQVTLRFTIPSRPDVGTSQLALAETGTGVYTATGANLSIDGAWKITAQIAGGSRTVEVGFDVTTRSAQPSIDVNKVPGLPTLYTVHLAEGNSVQVYLDPGTPGANELHVTFFDPAGNELPVPAVGLEFGPADQPLTALQPRQLEPGHFVSDTTAQAGNYRVSIAGTPPEGSAVSAETLTTQLTITVGK
jgi:copper transport protein